jgi:hypothetical protein
MENTPAAAACIKAGIVAQNIDRLSSNDRRHAYEAFCLICLLAKAGLHEPVLTAIKEHADLRVRLNLVHLLATTGQQKVLDELRELANDQAVGEEVKTAIVEGMYKLEQSKPKVEAVEDFVVQEHEFENSSGQEISPDFRTLRVRNYQWFDMSADEHVSIGFGTSKLDSLLTI